MPEQATTPTVHVFYDYVCPYAYIGKLRADAIERAYDVEIRWIPWEIYPNAIPEGEEIDFDAPEGYTTWVEQLAEEMGETLAEPDTTINSNLALRAALFAQDEDDRQDAGGEIFGAYHTAAFEAVWTEGRNLGDEDALREVIERADIGVDADTVLDAIGHHSYQYRLDLIDGKAEEELGIQRVPTFVFGDQRVVGNDRFEPSLKQPLEAFLERRKHIGEDWTSTLAWDTDLERVL